MASDATRKKMFPENLEKIIAGFSMLENLGIQLEFVLRAVNGADRSNQCFSNILDLALISEY